MKTIKEARQKSTAGEESTYRFWSASDSFATHAQPTKRRNLNKELEIDMLDTFGAKRTVREPVGLGGPAGDVMIAREPIGLGGPSGDVIAPEASAVSFTAVAADYSTQSENDEAEQAEQAELPEARILGYEVVDPNSPEIIRAKDQALSKAEETIRAKDQALSKAEETIRAKDQAIRTKNELLKAKDLAYKQMEKAKNEAIIRMHFLVEAANESVENKKRVIAAISTLVAE